MIGGFFGRWLGYFAGQWWGFEEAAAAASAPAIPSRRGSYRSRAAVPRT